MTCTPPDLSGGAKKAAGGESFKACYIMLPATASSCIVEMFKFLLSSIFEKCATNSVQANLSGNSFQPIEQHVALWRPRQQEEMKRRAAEQRQRMEEATQKKMEEQKRRAAYLFLQRFHHFELEAYIDDGQSLRNKTDFQKGGAGG